MPSFARELEQTLHNALSAASNRHHEYATLEHLLLALIDDEHAAKVMTACGVDLGELKDGVTHYLDTELDALKVPTGRTIDLVAFVDAAEIDPRHYDTPYFLLP